MDTRKRITLRLTGLDEDGGDIRLNEFVLQLDILKKALTETQTILSEKNFAYFRIVDLRQNSPAAIVLEAVPLTTENESKTQSLIDKFFRSIDEIHHGKYPEGFTKDTFDAYKDLTSLREKKKITEIVISRDGENPDHLYNLSNNIEKIVGEDEFEAGSYTGMLDAINIHNQNVFYIYPTSNLPKLKCAFSDELKKDAVSAIGKYVTVFGQKRLKPNIEKTLPYEMHAMRIEILPDEDTLPTLGELRGISPNITKGKSSEDFIRGIRNEW
ncbi:MAG: hypothetical protein ABSA51_03025 [Anaerolineaceae bacterium]|jgi:hypothetical protein